MKKLKEFFLRHIKKMMLKNFNSNVYSQKRCSYYSQ